MFLLSLIYCFCCCFTVTNNDSCNSNNKRSVSVLTWFCMCKCVSGENRFAFYLVVCVFTFVLRPYSRKGGFFDNWYTSSNLIYWMRISEWVWVVCFFRGALSLQLLCFAANERKTGALQKNEFSLVPSEISACENRKAVCSYWLNFACVADNLLLLLLDYF